MCGICCVVDLRGAPAPESNVRAMMAMMRHRGPDDEGTLVEGSVALGHVRLSIIDLSRAGHQPMLDESGRFAIVYNGEIYNYIELRRELESKHQFHTRTDTEVLLAAYLEWGEAFLDRLNGMFAFLILDRQSGELFAARDRFGVKPLYYHRDDNRLVMASEIPPILPVIGRAAEAEEQAVFDFLTFNRTDHGEGTFFRGVRRLPAGCLLRVRGGEVTVRRWYDLEAHLGCAFSSPQEFRDCLADSVSLRLRSDVPVGVCLSGGLDSSSLVALLLRRRELENVSTFSAVYPAGDPADESTFIREFEGSGLDMHFTTPTAETLLADLDRFVAGHAEPVPSASPYAQFKVMELAKQNVVVTLDGQGGDEQLAGYPYFFGAYFKELITHLRWLTLGREVAAYMAKQRSMVGPLSMGFFFLDGGTQGRMRARVLGYLRPEFAERGLIGSSLAHNLYRASTLHDSLVNHFEHKLEHLLKWEDRNSMLFSLEARVPFLDYRVVEGTLSLTSDQVIRNGWTKWILREGMKGILPERIRLRRDKMGFETPQDSWFRTPVWREYVADLLDSACFRQSPWVSAERCAAIHRRHVAGRVNAGKEIWKWVCLQRWQELLLRPKAAA